jgi:GDPmannose 4,6-dehydratase
MTKQRKKALITGITGQDGSYLAEFLLEKGYEVHGLIRRSSSFNTGRIMHLYQDPHIEGIRLFLHYGDLSEASSINRLVRKIRPDEIYNLGAQSHVRVSFDIPEYTSNVVALGALRLLEAIREAGLDKTKFYQASSSEMFGAATPPQNEKTPFHPRSPYAVSKVYAFWITKHYREAYGMFAANGILFNHESPRRGETFVTRKITKGIASIVSGKENKIYLGNLKARRDWGYAPEFVEAMYLMMRHKEPDDFVIATGETHSVQEFAEEAFNLVGLNWKQYIAIDPRYFRPAEADVLLGDASKAKKIIGWKPRVKFKDLARIMLEADLKEAGFNPENIIRKK